ncbi:MAG: right-handed parallel beta-helix repeat-containing protein [Caldilineaceae bacterium]
MNFDRLFSRLRLPWSRRLVHSVVMAAIGVGMFAGLLLIVNAPLHIIRAQSSPVLRYSTSGASGKTITIGRPYSAILPEEEPYVAHPSDPDAPKLSITLPEILTWAESRYYTDTLHDLGNGLWELEVTLLIEDNAHLEISSASGVKALRLISRPDVTYNIIAKGGSLTIDGVTVYAWDNSPGVNSYDTTYLTDGDNTQTRSYLTALYGGRMEIKNSEMMYLGYEELNDRVGYGKGEPSGLSWRLLPEKSTDIKTGPTGAILNSKVHNNYFGMYSYEAYGIVISNTEVYSNYLYGLDPHDGSSGFVVANNYVHDNGYTGIIFSRLCEDNVIYGNRVHHNGSHGIMLDRGSNHNAIYNNEVIGSKEDGIVLYQSKHNAIYGNTIKAMGRYGIRMSADFDEGDLFDDVASDNIIRNNTVSNSGKYGIYVSQRADRNWILDNQVTGSQGYGILLNAGMSIVQGNIITDSLQDGLIINDEPYRTGTNAGGASKEPVGQPGRDNQILGNRILKNGERGIEVKGGGANQIGSLGAGNIIEENRDGGILLTYSEATTLDSNQLRANVAANGAGITAKCVLTAPVTHIIVNNVIVDNQSTDEKGRGAGLYIGDGCLPQINDNWIYHNLNNGVEANLQNRNPAGSPVIDASHNIWAQSDLNAVENTIWHSVDDSSLSEVKFAPLGSGPITPPPTPSPTPTPIATFTPTATPTSVVTGTPTPTATPTSVVTGNGNERLYLPLVNR